MATDAASDAVEGCPRCRLLDELEGDPAALAPQGRPITMDRDQVEVEVEHCLAAGPPVQAQDVHRIGPCRSRKRPHERGQRPVHRGEFSVRHIPDLRAVRLRDHENMAATHGAGVHEREHTPVLQDRRARCLTRHDPAEDAVGTSIPTAPAPGRPDLRHLSASPLSGGSGPPHRPPARQGELVDPLARAHTWSRLYLTTCPPSGGARPRMTW
jgi:hypothetical protein